MRLTDWYAKRAGGRITVYGRGEGGDPVRIAGIDRIEPRNGRVFAVDKTGEEHELALA